MTRAIQMTASHCKPIAVRLSEMVTVHRAFGFRFVIFVNDHSPPHLHVVGHGGEAKITLQGPSGLTLDWSVGIDAGSLRRLMHEVMRERRRLIEEWERIHG